MRKFKIKSYGRFSIFLIVVILLISGIFMFLFNNVSKVEASSLEENEYVIVKSGDTLWSIAKKYSNTDDVREMVYKISKANNLDDEKLTINSRIYIPK